MKKVFIFFILCWLILPASAQPSGVPPLENGEERLKETAKVAIVIDDFGSYETGGVEEILSLGIPVTCAIMPNLENTEKHAEVAYNRGHQIIVHLPLEPISKKPKSLGPGAITMNLTEEEIKVRVRDDFDSVPHAVGFNNHMGSAATASDRVLRPILEVAREKKYFVLDSRTTEKTRLHILSDEMGIVCVDRTVFLDEIKNAPHIKKQMLKLSQDALKKGSAVGIGHVGTRGRTTAEALKEMIPQMKAMGIEFVYLSEIAAKNGNGIPF